MPALSVFYGIIVMMYREEKERHHTPHIHVRYGEYEAIYALDGRLLAGRLPKNKERLLWAWMEIHQEDLWANWELAESGQAPFRIAPLR